MVGPDPPGTVEEDGVLLRPFRIRVKGGDRVKRGQILGSVSDPFGEEEFLLKAREGGWVIAVNRLPVVNKGDAVLHIGKEKE